MYLIIPISEDSIVHHISVIDPVPSDHYTVCCKVLLPKPSPEKKETAYRNLKCIDFARFREDIRNLNLLDNDITSIADLVEEYNAKLALLFDDHARDRNKVVTLRPKSPWFTCEIREQKMKPLAENKTNCRQGNLQATMYSCSQAHSYVQSKLL